VRASPKDASEQSKIINAHLDRSKSRRGETACENRREFHRCLIAVVAKEERLYAKIAESVVGTVEERKDDRRAHVAKRKE